MMLTLEGNPVEIQQYQDIDMAPLRGPLFCYARFPGRPFTCTLAHQHVGPHVAHAKLGVVVAVWDRVSGDGANRERIKARGKRLLLVVGAALLVCAALAVIVARRPVQELAIVAVAMLVGYATAHRAHVTATGQTLALGSASGIIRMVGPLLLVGLVLLSLTAGPISIVDLVILGGSATIFPLAFNFLSLNWMTVDR